MAKELPKGSFQITNGPSKFDLMCSLFDGKKVKISCDILPEKSGSKICPLLEVRFTSIGPEDGSNESWLGTICLCDPHYETGSRKFYYNSKTRKGVVHAI
jgi:hypothetical protein